MKKENKRKGLLVILASSMVLISSMAFFTDRKVNNKTAKMGDLGIDTILRQNDTLDNVAPGDKLDFDLEVSNIGTLDADTRMTYRVSVPEEGLDLYEKDDLKLSVDGVELVNLVNTEFTYDSGLILTEEAKDYSIEMFVNDELKNKVQELNFKLEILTEARQPGSSDWEVQQTEEIKFGGRDDFEVVPNNNIIRSNEFAIHRGVSLAGSKNNGYVATSLKTLTGYTAESFKGDFLNKDENLKIYDKDGNALNEGSLVLSNFIIKLEDENKIHDELTIIIKGDLDDNGRITVNDMLSFNYSINKQLVLSPEQKAAADIDGDGLITMNDSMILGDYLSAIAADIPNIYPKKPKLKEKPEVSITFGDNDYLDYEYDQGVWEMGDEITSGSFVNPGQIMKATINVDDLKGLDLASLYTIVDFDRDLVDIGTDESGYMWLGIPENGDGIIPYRGNSIAWHHYGDDVPGEGVIINGNAHGLSKQGLTGPGRFLTLAFKVKDDALSGSRIEFKLKETNFSYKGFGDLYFNDIVDKSITKHFIVK